MKKVFLLLLSAVSVMASSCGSNDGSSKQQTAVKDSTIESRSIDTTNGQSANIVPDKESRATAELCVCMNSSFADMSPQVRAIIIKAGKSSTPLQTLAMEMQQIKGIEEQERLIREFDRFESDTQLQRCSESIKKKYNLDENNPDSREKVLKAAGKNKECEVVYALMKIGLEQEKSAGAVRK